MSTHGQLSNGETPNMEIVNFFDHVNIDQVIEQFCDIQFLWCGFHENNHAVFENRDCCEDAQNSEYDCANWISIGSILIALVSVYNYSSYHYTNTLYDISKDVDHSCSDIHVLVVVVMIVTS